MKTILLNKIKTGLISTIFFFLITNSAYADSPLTSTDLANSYEDMTIISIAKNSKKLEKDVLNFLLSEAPLDQKAAVINALGWNFDGQNNGYLFLEGLAKSKGLTINNLTIKDLTSFDKFVLGYLLAMDDYFNLSPIDNNSSLPLFRITPLELLTSVVVELPDDFTAHFVRALVEGQKNLENPQSWCNVYQVHQLVLNQFPPDKRNLRPSAIANIMDYVNLYNEYCNGKNID
ncbi:hypothetical protein GM3709_3495 [Geminocystis sp. NIES-3709]|nr:hypothetical protein GM3709_3495 [Geminocystis sp. NIES-3709]